MSDNYIEQKAEEYARRFKDYGQRCCVDEAYQAGFRAALAEALPLIEDARFYFSELKAMGGPSSYVKMLERCGAFLEKYEGEL